MSKVAHYLQEHLVGEVMTGTDARRYFASDGSILQIAPALIAYPRNENDVRKVTRFSWQLAERGRVIPVTARGAGSDLTGAALGSGIMLVFPAHLNRILELDTKTNTVTVEPGINYSKLQQTLHTHGRFLPPYPPSYEYSTIGGAIANNDSGEKSVKYGDTAGYIKTLRVVLANGEVIETSKISKRELSKKLGLATFEGEIYRSLDTLIEENHLLIDRLARDSRHNNAGYNLIDVKQKDGSFNLTPLIAGSQGTLGIITEAVLETEAHNPQTTLLMAQFDSLEFAQQAILELFEMSSRPSALELIDGNVLEEIYRLNPNQIKDIIAPPFPFITLLVEFEHGDKHLKKVVKKADKILSRNALSVLTSEEPEQQQQWWKLRQTTSAILAHNDGQKHAAILNDPGVPLDRVREYIEGVYSIFKVLGIQTGLWGHAGDGNLLFSPSLNLAQVGDRQKAFRLMEECNKLAISLGGTISSNSGDGRLKTPYLESMYGSELYALLQKVKQIFDPYGTLNPGVKFGTSLDDLKAMINTNYGLGHLYDHLPRS